MTYREGFVEANGLRLHYLDWGGDGPPALFVHPTGFHAHVWEPFAEHLADRFHCLALDTRGHGDSDKPGVYGWTDFAADLEAFCDRLELRDAVGIGHSAGGTAIAVTASRRPEIFGRAALLDPILMFEPRPPVPADSPTIARARRRRMRFADRRALFENYASKPPFNVWEPSLLELYVNHGVSDEPDGTVVLKCSGDDEAEMYRWGPRPLPTQEILANVTCPVLLITGERSDSVSQETARRAAATLPHCEWLTLPTGHFVPFERPQETMAAIDRFLEKEQRGAAELHREAASEPA